jgi:hypothetical protein
MRQKGLRIAGIFLVFSNRSLLDVSGLFRSDLQILIN